MVLGYGRVGQELATWLENHDVPFMVVESQADLLEPLQARGIATLAGDASSPQLLDQCDLPRARMVAVTTARTRSRRPGRFGTFGLGIPDSRW